MAIATHRVQLPLSEYKLEQVSVWNHGNDKEGKCEGEGGRLDGPQDGKADELQDREQMHLAGLDLDGG
jgi:hypothetical protein